MNDNLPQIRSLVGLLEKFDPDELKKLRQAYPQLVAHNILFSGEKEGEPDDDATANPDILLPSYLAAIIKSLEAVEPRIKPGLLELQRSIKISNLLQYGGQGIAAASGLVAAVVGIALPATQGGPLTAVAAALISFLASICSLTAKGLEGTQEEAGRGIRPRYYVLLDSQQKAHHILGLLQTFQQQNVVNDPKTHPQLWKLIGEADKLASDLSKALPPSV